MFSNFLFLKVVYFAGGKICLSDHFKPLWARNVPKFGIAHAMALGLGPWLAVEVPDLLAKGLIKHNDEAANSGDTKKIHKDKDN